jgi:hypothetical protein
MYAIQAWQTQNAWQGELIFLNETQALDLSLSTPTQILFDARIAALEAAIAGIAYAIPAATPTNAIALLTASQPCIAYGSLIESWLQSAYEAVPSGLTAASLVANANAEVAAWQEVFDAVVTVQGMGATQAQDAPARMLASSAYIANGLASLQSGPFDSRDVLGASDPSTLWNQMVSLPTLTTLASLLFSPPHVFINQECGAIKHTLGLLADNLALLLLTLRKSVSSTINLAQVRTNDSLMDVAARNLGDYSQWSNIAALNGLSAPWTGYAPDSTTIANYGNDILLPPSFGSNYVAGYPVPSYVTDILGVDIYLGPMNAPMPPWTGDFQTITGYANLAFSLGRRLQTTIGDLIYHTQFGSRIPPEVGSVQAAYELQRISAYGESALLSDGRVSSVVSATATAPSGGNSLVTFSATVQPVGFGTQPISVNQTFTPVGPG